jgi:hypothetical protein
MMSNSTRLERIAWELAFGRELHRKACGNLDSDDFNDYAAGGIGLGFVNRARHAGKLFDPGIFLGYRTADLEISWSGNSPLAIPLALECGPPHSGRD